MILPDGKIKFMATKPPTRFKLDFDHDTGAESGSIDPSSTQTEEVVTTGSHRVSPWKRLGSHIIHLLIHAASHLGHLLRWLQVSSCRRVLTEIIVIVGRSQRMIGDINRKHLARIDIAGYWICQPQTLDIYIYPFRSILVS